MVGDHCDVIHIRMDKSRYSCVKISFSNGAFAIRSRRRQAVSGATTAYSLISHNDIYRVDSRFKEDTFIE